jgi:hypothetical protein
MTGIEKHHHKLHSGKTTRTSITVIPSERESRRSRDERERGTPGMFPAPMQAQGVLTMLCPGKRISEPQCSARSCQRELVFSMSAIFFWRRQDLICFSRLMAL